MRGTCGAARSKAVGLAGKAQHIAVLLPAPSDLRAHHPQCGEQDHALHAV